jgi:prepilin-type N-terminal cleavage/methylation domain-containing protein
MMSELRRAQRAGFTLIELLVSLTAGLVIALAVFAVSKDATETFHEEARMATTEMTLRIAAERIRADFMRASFMSTPNVWVDHQLAYSVTGARVPGPAPLLFQWLAGIRICPTDPSIQPLSTVNGFWGAPNTPVCVELTGNMTSTDLFPVRMIQAGGVCGGQQITLQTDTPSMWRIIGNPNPQDMLRGLFQPVPLGQFMVRLVDTTGKVQFAPLCSGNPVNITGAGANSTITVDIDNTAVQFLTTQQTVGNGGIAGLCNGCTINPVQTIRYEIRKLDPNGNTGDTPYAAMQPTVGLGANDKYDLVRTWRTLDDNQLGPTEVVAEYGVDFKLAFTADLNPAGSLTRPLTTYGFDDPGGGNDIIAGQVGPASPAKPHRIRSVRLRLTTRAAMADRYDPLNAPAANALQGPYPFRYCLNTGGCPVQQVPSDQYARLRTTITELALPNQARNFD